MWGWTWIDVLCVLLVHRGTNSSSKLMVDMFGRMVLSYQGRSMCYFMWVLSLWTDINVFSMEKKEDWWLILLDGPWKQYVILNSMIRSKSNSCGWKLDGRFLDKGSSKLGVQLENESTWSCCTMCTLSMLGRLCHWLSISTISLSIFEGQEYWLNAVLQRSSVPDQDQNWG
jgi:hypothetical protein